MPPVIRESISGVSGHLDIEGTNVMGENTRYRKVAAEARSADRAPGFCVLRRGKGLPPLAPHPHPRVWPPTSASLRMVRLDEVEQFAENQKASIASLMVFTFGPE